MVDRHHCEPIESVTLTRAEYIDLKAALANMRGLALPAPETESAESTGDPTEAENEAKRLELVPQLTKQIGECSYYDLLTIKRFMEKILPYNENCFYPAEEFISGGVSKKCANGPRSSGVNILASWPRPTKPPIRAASIIGGFECL